MSLVGKFSSETLMMMSYRELQKIGKRLQVPCNIKKVYLFDVIWYCVQGRRAEALVIAAKAKSERERYMRPRQKKKAKPKLSRVKLSEASSTNRLTPSPSITLTPQCKRPLVVLQHNSVPYKTIGKTTITRIVKRTSVLNSQPLNPEERDIHTQTSPDVPLACREILKNKQYPIYGKAAKKKLTNIEVTDNVVSSSQDLDIVLRSSSMKSRHVQVGGSETHLPLIRMPHEIEHDYDQPLDFTVKRELLAQNNNNTTAQNYNHSTRYSIENSNSHLYSSTLAYQSTEPNNYSYVMYRNVVHTENYHNLRNNYPEEMTEHTVCNTQVDLCVKNQGVYDGNQSAYVDLQNVYLPSQGMNELNQNNFENNQNIDQNLSVLSQNVDQQNFFVQPHNEQNQNECDNLDEIKRNLLIQNQSCYNVIPNANHASLPNDNSHTLNMIANMQKGEFQNCDEQNLNLIEQKWPVNEQALESCSQNIVELDSQEHIAASQDCKNPESYFHKKIRIQNRRLSEAAQKTAWSDESLSDSAEEPDSPRSSEAMAESAQENSTHNANSSEVVLPRFINAFIKLGDDEKDPYEPLYVNVEGPNFTSTPVARRLHQAQRRHSMPVETDELSVENQQRRDAAGSLLKIASSMPYVEPSLDSAQPSARVGDSRTLVPYVHNSVNDSYLTDMSEPDIPYLREYLRDTDPMDAFSMASSYSGSATEDLEALASQVEDLDSVSSGTVLSGMRLLRFDPADNLGATVTVDNTLDDKDISQDYVYTSQVDNVQCALCEWNRSAEELEEHIVKVHYAEIKVLRAAIHRDEPISLGTLVREKRKAVVFRWLGKLYALVVKYEDPEWLMASLSTLTPLTETPLHTSITTYNKVTGQPFTWEGPSLRTNLAFSDPDAYLKVQLSKINVMPNSANVLLSNGELVSQSPDKRVICGNEILDEIDIWFKVGFY